MTATDRRARLAAAFDSMAGQIAMQRSAQQAHALATRLCRGLRLRAAYQEYQAAFPREPDGILHGVWQFGQALAQRLGRYPDTHHLAVDQRPDLLDVGLEGAFADVLQNLNAAFDAFANPIAVLSPATLAGETNMV